MIDWEQIVSRHGDLVWKTAYRLLGNHADALDCQQETFLAAVEFARRKEVHDWPALLQHLATARAIDRLRRLKSNARRQSSRTDVSNITSCEPGPESRAEESELVECLRQALTTLPENQAEVYCLRFINDLSYEQIAVQMGLQTSHVGALLHRARARLRTMLVPRVTTPNQAAPNE